MSLESFCIWQKAKIANQGRRQLFLHGRSLMFQSCDHVRSVETFRIGDKIGPNGAWMRRPTLPHRTVQNM